MQLFADLHACQVPMTCLFCFNFLPSRHKATGAREFACQLIAVLPLPLEGMMRAAPHQRACAHGTSLTDAIIVAHDELNRTRR